MDSNKTLLAYLRKGKDTANQNKGAAQAAAILASGQDAIALSHDGLQQQIEYTARSLHAMGFDKHSRIATAIPSGAEQCVTTLSVCANFTAAPFLNNYTQREYESYFRSLKTEALIVPEEAEDNLAVRAAESCGMKIVRMKPTPEKGVGTFELSGEKALGPTDDTPPGPDDIALLLHTSGSTGDPKIVPLSQANLCAVADNAINAFGLTQDDRSLNLVPLVHISSFVTVLSSLSAGGSIYCVPKFSTSKFFEWLNESQATWYSGVATMHQNILSKAMQSGAGEGGVTLKDLAPDNKLRLIRSSAMPILPQDMEGLRAFFNTGNAHPVRICNAFSMSEAGNSLVSAEDEVGSSIAMVNANPKQIEVTILDDEGHPVGQGEVGELCVKGPHVFGGYENKDDSHVIARDDFTEDGWFRSGDLARMDPRGRFVITGRKKEMIRPGGSSVSPLEVDEILLQHPDVKEVATFPVRDAKYGETIAVAIVLNDAVDVSSADKAQAEAESITQFAGEHLAHFKLPKGVIFAREIPKLASGKIHRGSLGNYFGVQMPGITANWTGVRVLEEEGPAPFIPEVIEASRTHERTPEEERAHHVQQAQEVYKFLHLVMEIPPVPIVDAPGLSALLGERVLLQMEMCNPHGNSTKSRNAAGLAYGIASYALATAADRVEIKFEELKHAALQGGAASLSSEQEYILRHRAALSVALKGVTFVASSTGSHARAIAELGKWLREEGIADVPVKLFVTSDITDGKRQALVDLGAEVIKGGNMVEVNAKAQEYVRGVTAGSERRFYMPTDPIDARAYEGGYNLNDGFRGFATVVMDSMEYAKKLFEKGELSRPVIDEMFMPTSCGPTWAAATAYAHHTKQNAEVSHTSGQVGDIIAVEDINARAVHESLATGKLEQEYPIPADAPSINGLTEPDMNAYSFAMTKDLVTDADHFVDAASMHSIKLAQLLVAGETGVIPEPAGAAALAARVVRAITAGQITGINIATLLKDQGYAKEDLDRFGFIQADIQAIGIDSALFYNALRRDIGKVGNDAPRDKAILCVISGAYVGQNLELICGKVSAALESGALYSGTEQRFTDDGLSMMRFLAYAIKLIPETDRAVLAEGAITPEIRDTLQAVNLFSAQERKHLENPSDLAEGRLLAIKDIDKNFREYGLYDIAQDVDLRPAVVSQKAVHLR